jgi:hypothetical protein
MMQVHETLKRHQPFALARTSGRSISLPRC